MQGLAASLALFGLIWAFVLQPLTPLERQYTPSPPEGVQYWSLSTGSRVAVRKFDREGAIKREPVIMLHGGPGSYAVGLNQTFEPISQLRLNGHDVYFYDQVGGGLSDRLEDITEYALDRHIDDLKAVFTEIGSPQVILIGSSFGATLAANYMAGNPSHISRAVFTGPGPIYKPDWRETSDGSLDEAMSASQKAAFDRAVQQPRMLVAILLSDINPYAAVRFLPSREAGSFFDEIADEHYLQHTVCDFGNVKTSTKGYGFWSNRMTGKSLLRQTADPKPILRDNLTPVLIIRGACDYKSEAVAAQYDSVFPNSTLLTFEDAGHMVYWEKPRAFLDAVRVFVDED